MNELVRAVPRRILRVLKAPAMLLLALAVALVLVAMADNAVPRPASAATQTLSPSGAGTQTNLDVFPSGTNWAACSAAGGAYVSSNSNTVYETDLYTLPDPALTGTVNSVTVWITAQASGAPTQPSAQTVVRTGGGTITYGTEVTLTTSWANYSSVYATIPGTSNPWTWAEVNDLQAGVALRKPAAGATSNCDQVWVVVDYAPPGTLTSLTVEAATGTYGATANLTATLSPAVAGKTIDFFINGESKGSATTLASGVATLSGVALTVGGVPLTVGTYTGTYNTSGVGASFAGDATYEPSTSAGDLTVNQKELTVSGITADDKTYNGSTDATIHTGSSALIGVVGSDNVTLNTGAASGAFATKDVGTGITVLTSGLTLDGTDAGRYVLIQPTTAASITAKPLTITANSTSKTYGDTVTFAGTEFTAPGLVAGDNVTSVTLTSAGAAAGAAVGSYDIVASDAVGTGLGNYAISYVNGTLTVNPPAPIISLVNPSQGVQGETLTVVISGSNFTGATAVAFGANISVNSFTADNATQITANITIGASAAPGLRDISVTSSEGTGTLTGAFTVNQGPPVLQSVTPNQGVQGQTENVTIYGQNFTGATSVGFGPGVTTNSFVVTPSSAPSEVQIGTGTVGHLPPFWTSYYDARTQSILMAGDIGQAGQIHKLRLYCLTRPGQDLSHFYIRMQHTTMSSFASGTYVNGGWTTVLHATNVDVDSWVVNDWVEFEFTTPFDYDGVSNLLIDYCLDNSYATSYGTVRATTNPAYRTVYYTANLASGDLLSQTTGSRSYYVDNIVLVMQNRDTIEANITVDAAATPGYRDVSVTTPRGTATGTNAFAVLGVPGMTSVNPTQALQGQSLGVTITGTNLFGTTAVGFGSGITVDNFTVNSNTQVTVSITVSASAAPGTRTVSVTNGAGTATLTDGFTVNQTPPTISSVSPNQRVQGQTVNVTISGNYFTTVSSVSFGSGITVNSFTANSVTQITASITIDGAATPGYRNVSVTTAGGTGTLTNGFTVLAAPTISSVYPAQAVQGQSLNVTITGTNLLGATAVSFGSGITVSSFTVNSDTQIAASIAVSSSAIVGTRDVSVTKAGFTATLTGGFTVNQAPPTITSATPNQGVQTQTLDVTISGAYFTGATSVSFGPGIAVTSFAVISATQITANLTISPSAGAGLRDFSVTTPVGTATRTNGFTVLTMPSISSVSPSQAVQGQALSVTITGTNLSGVTAVGFGSGVSVNSFTVDSNTQITASITVSHTATLGTRDVSVTKAGVSASLPSSFTVNRPPPEVVSVIPNQGIQGQTENVTVTGANFTGATAVSFGPGIVTNSFVVTPSAGSSEVQVGTGTGTWDYPFSTYYEDIRTQSILLASEIGQPGEIHKLRLYCTSTGRSLEHFYIRMQHTTMSSYSSGSFVNSGWTTVLHVTNVSLTTGWVEFEFTTPFQYDGVSNLLIDYCVDNGDWSSSSYCRYTSTATYRTVYYRSDLGASNALSQSTGTRISQYNNVQLVMYADTITATITIGGSASAGPRDVSVTTPWGSDTMTNGFMVIAMPAISSVSPNQAAQGQTLSVTITGTNLYGVTSVDLGSSITVNSFTVNSGTQITASITVGGSATLGARNVSATNAAGTGTLISAFTVNQPPPTMSSVNPNQEVQGQTLDVIIWGTNFTGATSVSFGSGIATNSFSVDSATQITANITIGGSATPGLRDVSVTTPGGTTTLTNGFTVLAMPALISASPGQAVQGQMLSVTLTGTDLLGVTTVGFGPGITVNSFTVGSNTQITASITIDGAATIGARDVSVTKAGGTATLTNGFLVVAMPDLTTVDPTQAVQGQTLSVTLTGTDLLGVTIVDFGSGITVNSFTVDNSTQITTSIAVSGSATVGMRDVSVTNAAGTDTLTSGFMVKQAPPAIASVNPGQGIQGQTENVTITGNYFTGATLVSFGPGITTNSFTVDNNTQITASITIDGAAAAGYRDVSVTTPDGSDTEINGFLVVAIPDLTTVNPTQATQGQTLSVTLTGTDLLGVTIVDFGSGISVNSLTVDNSTQITVSITVSGSATVGTRDVSVTNAAGTDTLTSGFMIKQAPPAIASVTPRQGILGQTENVRITGNYFTGATLVSFGPGVTTNSFTVDNSTQITVSITIDGAATPGYRDVSVTTPDGSDTKANSFLVVGMPTISSVSPGQAVQGQALSVTITGTNLTGVTVVDFGSLITVNSFTVDSNTQITASITVSSSATPGARSVSVANTAGTATLASGMMINQVSPTIGLVNPKQGVQTQTIEVTVLGTCFTNATVVSFGADVTTNSFTVDSATQIRANITIGGSATPGLRDVSVTTPGGTATLPNGFTILAMPSISAVSASQGTQGQTLNVTITGSNLLGVTAVGFGSGVTVISFTVDSSTQITANISIGAGAAVGPRNVSVTDPAAVGSLADGFTVVAPSPPPSVAALTPASGNRGEKLEVIITGASFTGATDVRFGEGVDVIDFTVDSATQITVQVNVDGKAAPGKRGVSVITPDGTVTMDNAFEVQAKPGSGGVPVYVWLLPLVVIAAAGLLLLAFLLKRRKKKPAEIGAGSDSAS